MKTFTIVKLRSRSRSGEGQVRVRRLRRVRFGHELYNIFNTAHQVLMFGCVSPNLKIQLTECSRMFQNVCRMIKNAFKMHSECSRMFQNVPECSRMPAKCSRMHAQCFRMFKNQFRMFQNAWRMFQNV